MSSWYSSWFSGLPSFDFALPSGIQRRFFSFLLKRSLGHLLKPGQLDLHQIDSQIGSGYVQVKDLELDDKAVNALLAGLPVTLHDGSITCVTARIPFPNPLTSSVGLTVQSLRLTLHVNPDATSYKPPTPHSNLADSAISVAESFIHDELSSKEEAIVRESIHPDTPFKDETGRDLPGGLDPFLANLGTGDNLGDNDPAGVSVFATFIEQLLARFEFSALDTKITLVHPGQASFTFSISEIRYATEIVDGGGSSSGSEKGMGNVESESEKIRDVIRRVTISGISLTSRNLRQPLSSSPGSTPSTLSPVSPTSSRFTSRPRSPSVPRSRSPASSSSSLDDETQLLMSQSLASLPPRYEHRPSSPASSVTSSMYQSAISVAHESSAMSGTAGYSDRFGHTDHPSHDGTPRQRFNFEGHSQPAVSLFEEDLIMSFGVEPIVIQLRAPLLHQTASLPGKDSSGHIPFEDNQENFRLQNERFQLTISSGIAAFALRARHIRMLINTLDVLSSHSSSSSSPETSANPGFFDIGVEASINVRGIVILLLPATANHSQQLDEFYTRPLKPPRWPFGYLRVLLEHISCSITLPGSLIGKPEPLPGRGSRVPQTGRSSVQSLSAKLTLAEMSIFTFYAMPSASSHTAEPSASPVLITDPYLPDRYSISLSRPSFDGVAKQQYEANDIRLTTFDTIDWTKSMNVAGSAKLSTWRAKPIHMPSKSGNRVPLQSPRMPVSKLPTSPKSPPESHLDEQEVAVNAIPAVSISMQGPPINPSSRSANRSSAVDVQFTPLHFFVDLGMIMEGGLLPFVEEIMSSTTTNNAAHQSHRGVDGTDLDSGEDNVSESSEEDGDNDAPRKFRHMTVQERNKQKERIRLEKLVLDDLNLSLDYRTAGAPSTKNAGRKTGRKAKRKLSSDQQSATALFLPMIRIEIRSPPPPLRTPRSGSLVLDLHNIHVSNKPFEKAKPVLRFSDASSSTPRPRDGSADNELLNAQCQNIALAYSSYDSTKATVFLTFGPLPIGGEAASALLSTEHHQSSLPLCFTVTQSSVQTPDRSNTTKTAVIVVDPLLNAVLPKFIFDGLQQWADDVSQAIERSLNKVGETETDRALSRDPSLIGSRFFAKSRRVGSRNSDESGLCTPTGHSRPQSETVVKLTVTEAFIRVLLPRANGNPNGTRPFDVHASDIDLLLELKPEGKEQSIVTSSVFDLRIFDTTSDGTITSLVSLTSHRSLSSMPKPMVKAALTSFIVPETTSKESKIRLSFWGFTFHAQPDMPWISDLASFAKAPPGVFESVVPSERTRITVNIMDCAIKMITAQHPGAAVLHIGAADLSTELVGNSTELEFKLSIPSVALLFVDSVRDVSETDGIETTKKRGGDSIGLWKAVGFALIAEVINLDLFSKIDSSQIPSDTRVTFNHVGLRIHICADTLDALTGFISNATSGPSPPTSEIRIPAKKAPTTITEFTSTNSTNMMGSVDEEAFRKIPEVGTVADMIGDDLPSNLDYLDASFGTAAGLRELRDDDLDDFDTEEASGRTTPTMVQQTGVVSNVGGETIKINQPLRFIDNYYSTINPDLAEDIDAYGDTTLRIRIHSCDITLFLYDGYDWARTRKIIEQEVKDMRRRLAKIRQLAATGQTHDPDLEDTSALLFNSMHIGLEQDLDDLEPAALIAAIDDELNDNFETDTQSSWQSLHPASPEQTHVRSTRVHGRRLTRSKGPSIEIRLSGLDAEVDQYRPGELMVSRTLAIVKDVEILDHIKTSTWRKFLTDLRADARGNVRETDSNMVRVELRTVNPSPLHASEEARLRAKILPLRLYVDQDALDFLKKFFSFKDLESPASAPPSATSEEIYFQHAEVFPVDIKLDYKPRRVDYRALREGKTIELMNFFHFDGSEMTLRHLTFHGITGWPRFFDSLNDLWTPDVKATQLVDVISGVAPIRSVVNVGSGVADLVLLPIAQYKKDGRIVRGVQKGTKSFVQSTAMEAIKLGARLATGTQVILEQAEGVLGGQFKDSVTTETLQIPYEDDLAGNEDDEDLISKYAEQPRGVTEGVQTAYKSLQKNFNSAAQTILAVPMEVYERSGNEGAVRAVIRAVPIAVLKPMIGASEAVSKTLMGLHNTLDPNVRHENEAKYKQR
ncbi:hypothetical protein BJ138DRAFT_1124124 [Hygrophoropsis aurantiaca]|uniref:Uncharacterized protein n=1 Tax=Hygrophoropsis aurantiaca TaxID=72124 RepID=A0ACB8AJU4_9AGAM|nr:hypothetical protein BJ138DRAFT_1124124 [Hygrophoropsis aurantiaca]